MAAKPKKEKEGFSLFNWIGIGILAVAYFTAFYHMMAVNADKYDPDTIIIRFTHWQLESGIREGLDVLAREFEKEYYKQTGKKVKMVQNAISEKAYRQYVQIQCIGRTAPDLIEIGKYDYNYTRRFFITNSEDIKKPNPYNKGTELEGVPWADTYIDGMQGSMDRETLEYYGAGLATVTVRLFYNEKLMQQVLGTTAPPRNFREFIKACEKFDQWAKENGKIEFTPIAGSQYQLNLFRARLVNCMLHRFGMENDRNFDGRFDGNEAMRAYLEGSYNLNEPAIRAGYQMLRELTRFFPTGFMSQDRMEAGFRFTQGNAAFITSGSWDAMSYFTQADFPVGVMDFPLPDKDDPDYGQFLSGRPSESSFWSGLRFGITKFSKHPEVALAFLHFLTTKENNEKFNKICKWIPLIKGAKPHKQMEPFMPNPDGFWGCDPMFFEYNGRTRMIFNQALWEFVEHKTDFDQFHQQIMARLPRATAVDLQRAWKRTNEGIIQKEVPLSWQIANTVYTDSWQHLPREERDQAAAKAATKVQYLWGNKLRSLGDFVKGAEWVDDLQQKSPRALKVKEFMTIKIGEEE